MIKIHFLLWRKKFEPLRHRTNSLTQFFVMEQTVNNNLIKRIWYHLHTSPIRKDINSSGQIWKKMTPMMHKISWDSWKTNIFYHNQMQPCPYIHIGDFSLRTWYLLIEWWIQLCRYHLLLIFHTYAWPDLTSIFEKN